MKWQSEECTDRMGAFHNDLVALVDKCELEPQEIIVVLRMLTGNIEKLFETAVKAPKKKEEADGG